MSFHATVANYEYLVYWRFYQDGNIECEVRATGIMVTTHFPEGEAPPYGTLVDERTYAPFHQHFIVARLDLDVDGEQNTVHMIESEALAVGPDNPDGLAIVQRSTPLRTEEEGKQDYRWETQRAWKVVNAEKKNGLGTPVGYKLVPGGAIPGMMDPSSPGLPPGPGDRPRPRGSPPTRGTSAFPAASSSYRRTRTPGFRPGRPPTARSRTPTWCSGTCSASTT